MVITSFEECAEAGYPVMESYPRQCRTAEGKLFVETIPTSSTSTDPGVSTSTQSMLQYRWAERNGVVVADQPIGRTVVVSAVHVEKPTWLVIHADQNGKPGPVLGATYFEAGDATGTVALTQSLNNTLTYYAVLHADDGDKRFSEAKDKEVISELDTNKPIMALFQADASVRTPLEVMP